MQRKTRPTRRRVVMKTSGARRWCTLCLGTANEIHIGASDRRDPNDGVSEERGALIVLRAEML